MTNEEKQLLLKDLCARLPYGVRLHIVPDSDFSSNFEPTDGSLSLELLEKYGQWDIYHPFIMMPYLRPMSSMTEEEKSEYHKTHEVVLGVHMIKTLKSYEWLNAHHFDYRGLIEKGLALEAPEGMYES